MRVKLNFSDPLSVSPHLRYDKLNIYLRDANKLFDQISFSGRRELSHIRNDVLMKKPIQKQMIEDSRGRQMIKYLYDFRFTVSDFFLLSFLVAILFRGPFDRLLKMMLELQLMVNLALMHIHMPANAMLGLQILKPMSEFRIQKEFRHKQKGYFELKYQSEDSMAYFGQRYTFGYDTYNIIFNMGTMGHILLFFLIFVGVIYAIKSFYEYCQIGKK